jgi:hypothetical protein
MQLAAATVGKRLISLISVLLASVGVEALIKDFMLLVKLFS